MKWFLYNDLVYSQPSFVLELVLNRIELLDLLLLYEEAINIVSIADCWTNLPSGSSAKRWLLVDRYGDFRIVIRHVLMTWSMKLNYPCNICETHCSNTDFPGIELIYIVKNNIFWVAIIEFCWRVDPIQLFVGS